MRILKFLFSLVVIAVVLGAFLFTIGGTLWLHIGTVPFIHDAQVMIDNTAQIQPFIQMCRQSPASSDLSTPIGFQMRFLDSSTYQVELVCSLIENTPIVLRTGKLLPFITKAPGSAGLDVSLTDDVTSGVVLTSLGKQRVVQLNRSSITFPKTPEAGISENRINSECSGFGYMCCDEQSESGNGQQILSGVTDCSNRCFQTCSKVPFVELFGSDPVASVENHEILMRSDSLNVVFNYSVNTPKPLQKVVIDYGDGSTQESTQQQGLFTHTFACSGPCRRTVMLRVSDTSGAVSVDNKTSTFYIVHN